MDDKSESPLLNANLFDRPVSRFTAAVPLYIQIAEGLLDQIESGELSPGDRLPSERELSGALDVNRMTLRRALRLLETRGLLVRRRGDGTYVAEPKIERQAGQLVPFTRGMERRGYVPGARIITLEKRPADAAVAQELGLPVSAPVYFVRRLRLLNQEPVMLERLTVPAHRFPGFEHYDFSSRSVYAVMEKEYGVTVVRARQSLEPVVATEYEAELLEVQAGAPLMLERRLGFDRDDQPIEHGKDLYRGDRFRFVTEIAPLEL
jgi:GntR family transcriptional regulator